MVKNYKEVLYDIEALHSKNLILRKFKKSDAEDLLEYASDDETLKYLFWGGVKEFDEAKNMIIDIYSVEKGFFAIELKENKKCIGSIDINIDEKNEKASFGYILNKKYWGKGYMSEALSTILMFCFEKLKVNRVEASCFEENFGSRKVMEKCNMKLEGIFKKEAKTKDVFHDVYHYGIIKDDFIK